MRVQVSEP